MIISEQCPLCNGIGLVGTDSIPCIASCPKCHGSGEVDADPPTCKACGKTLHDHLGHEGQCRRLQEAKSILRDAGLVLSANGHSAMAGLIAAFLKEEEASA